MTSVEKVSAAVAEWGSIVLSKALPQVGVPADSAIGKFMSGILNIDPATYNLWNELGFLMQPVAEMVVTPMVSRMLASFPEDQVGEMAMKIADAFAQQAREKGAVNLFGMEIGPGAFERLKEALAARLQEE